MEKEAAPIKIKTRPSAGKVLMMLFQYFRGVLQIDFLYESCAIKSAYYYELRNKKKLAHQQNSPIRGAIVLHNNARPHTTFQTLIFLLININFSIMDFEAHFFIGLFTFIL